MRISSIIVLLTLAACKPPAEDKVASAKADDRIDCALSGAKEFARDCAVERSGDGKALILRHRDGGFRRIALDADGALSAADGADDVTGKKLPDGRFEVIAGPDRYRLPPRT
jgi:hypothetical protein